METYDLIIIGGGILGSALAFFASHAGLRSALLEGRPSLAAHTTAKAVSCFRMQWDEPDFFYLMKNSINIYEHFGEITGLGAYDIGIHHQGWLFGSTAEDGPARFQTWIRGMRALGVEDSEYLDGDMARRRFPFLASEVTAATFRARDGWLSPYEAACGFVSAAQSTPQGLSVRMGTPVQRIKLESGRVTGVETRDGALSAPRIAICAGPHSTSLAAACGISLPIILLRRQRAFVANHDWVPTNAPMVADDDTGAYWRPESGGAFLGWAQEEPPQPALEEVPADPDFAALTLDACGRLTPFWREVADHLRASDVKVAAGQYSITPDGKPLIGPSEIEGLYFLTGDNGFGVESGPQAACHLVGVLTGEIKAEDNPFRLDRPMHKTKKIVL